MYYFFWFSLGQKCVKGSVEKVIRLKQVVGQPNSYLKTRLRLQDLFSRQLTGGKSLLLVVGQDMGGGGCFSFLHEGLLFREQSKRPRQCFLCPTIRSPICDFCHILLIEAISNVHLIRGGQGQEQNWKSVNKTLSLWRLK